MSVETDNGIKRRLQIEQLDSDFVDELDQDDEDNCRFKKDNRFGETLQNKYKHALLG